MRHPVEAPKRAALLRSVSAGTRGTTRGHITCVGQAAIGLRQMRGRQGSAPPPVMGQVAGGPMVPSLRWTPRAAAGFSVRATARDREHPSATWGVACFLSTPGCVQPLAHAISGRRRLQRRLDGSDQWSPPLWRRTRRFPVTAAVRLRIGCAFPAARPDSVGAAWRSSLGRRPSQGFDSCSRSGDQMWCNKG